MGLDVMDGVGCRGREGRVRVGANLNGAGPAGWFRESGSGLPHSKAFGWLVLGCGCARTCRGLCETGDGGNEG